MKNNQLRLEVVFVFSEKLGIGIDVPRNYQCFTEPNESII